ncbi:NUDIX hydrolase [Streptomyces sp. NPDC007084]|uniref:NUDIX hydrolase n=1 Tax=Streptomyces sp. NPDC007084 TaxID=3154313 RepID=UPI0034537FDE
MSSALTQDQSGHFGQESSPTCPNGEAREEGGLHIERRDVELVQVVHHVDRSGDQPHMGLFFRAHVWSGEPGLREPKKCVSWTCRSRSAFSDDLVSCTRVAIEGIRAGRLYFEAGWV